MSFTPFRLSSKILANIESCGYVQPTPIQEEAIPEILAGHDVLGLAQTGTGKTAAFALPIIQSLLDHKHGKVRALVIAPTRELAEQIDENFKNLTRGTGLRSVTVYGGVGKSQQLQAFRQGVEIVVACPGRLLDHLNSRDLNLQMVETLVLDEADQMFDMGFFPDIRRILKHIPHQRQTLLFSATMPKDIRKLANETLTDPVEVQVQHDEPLDLIEQLVCPVSRRQKANLLRHFLKEETEGSTLIFTRTKYGAKNLAKKLEKSGYNATSLQGNMSQNQRQKALNGFRDGEYTIMVATDIAARGIDVSRVGQVINFDLPSTAEAYTHRIGRTGRAKRSGRAITFMCFDDQIMVRGIERLQGIVIERLVVDGFAMATETELKPKEQQRGGRGRKPMGNRRPQKQSRAKNKGSKPHAKTSAKRFNKKKAGKNSTSSKKGGVFGLS